MNKTLLTLTLAIIAACTDAKLEDSATDSALPDTEPSGGWVDLVCEINEREDHCFCDASAYGWGVAPIDAWMGLSSGQWTRPAAEEFDTVDRIYTLQSPDAEDPISVCVVALYVD